MTRRAGFAVAATLILLAAGCVTLRPDRAIRVATGFVSHTLCSATFVSRLDPEQVYIEAIKPMGMMYLLDWALRYHVDTMRQEVTASFARQFESRAIFRQGSGCLVAHGAAPPLAPLVKPVALDHPPPVESSDEELRAILDRVFARHDLATKAVVIIHDGRLVAERYASGYGPLTPLHVWSVRKSAISALVGILVRQGKIQVTQPAPVPSWRIDSRREITIDHLLRMTSGLWLTETNSGFDPVSRMLFLERDMAAFAEGTRLEARAGERWEYSTGNTIILGRIIRDIVGGGSEDVVRFAQRELFEPLGMSTASLEVDAVGTPTSMYASARDWARFGMLFAQDGIHGAQRILPDGWVHYSTTPTRERGYGAGWWLGGAHWRPDWNLPEDAFYASGLLHQKLLVIPSSRLVIARFGLTHAADDGFGWLAENVLRALAPDPARRRAASWRR